MKRLVIILSILAFTPAAAGTIRLCIKVGVSGTARLALKILTDTDVIRNACVTSVAVLLILLYLNR